MKILVVSLLRLGDIIQQIPLLKGLKIKYPHAAIHLLLNKQFKSVEKLLEGVVDHYIYFDRESIQKGLGEPNYHILWSYSQTEILVNELNKNSYDIAFNFTHNKLSAYLLGILNVTEKKGLFYSDKKFQGLSNRWLKYFNDHFSGTQVSKFHFIEILSKAFDIPIISTAEDSTKVLQSVELKQKNNLILFQCLTSEFKKNWPLHKFVELKNSIEKAFDNHKVSILSAPFEEEILLKFFKKEDLLICNLLEAHHHLQKADLLITVDTSIKHLAVQAGTPIVEIAIGSSDPIKTSAFCSNSVIVKSSVACFPCSHSQKCSQNSHICANDVSVHSVFAAVWEMINGEVKSKEKIDLDRIVWHYYLDQETETDKASYQRAVAQLSKFLSYEDLPKIAARSLEKTMLFRQWIKKVTESLPARHYFEDKKNIEPTDIADLILCVQEIIKSKKDEAGYFQSLTEALLTHFNHPIQIYERVCNALNEINELVNIQENLIYHLHSISTEGAYNAKGIGQLSDRSFEKAGESLPRNFKHSEL
ncbi:MAG: glycosyltransferase family 9 protein [Bdellovibrio sp.]